MPLPLIERLTLALENLQLSINEVKNRLQCKGQLSPQLHERLDSYSKMCDMQLRFTNDIQQSLQHKDYSEVTRLTNLINGLSAMILDDIRMIIGTLSGQAPQPQYYN